MSDEKFPTLGQALLVVLALFLIEYVVMLGLHDVGQVLGLETDEQTPFAVLLGNAVLLTVLMHAKGLTFRELLHPARHSMRMTVLLVVPPVALLVPALVLISGVLVRLLETLFPLSSWEARAFEGMAQGSLPNLVTVCLLAPLLEEMLFRGIVLRSFLRQYPRWPAICCSAMVFGLAHLNMYQFVLAFFLGVLLGWLYERTQSLAPSIALHAFFNATATAGSLGFGLEPLDAADTADPGNWAMVLLAAGIGAWLLSRLLSQPGSGSSLRGSETTR